MRIWQEEDGENNKYIYREISIYASRYVGCSLVVNILALESMIKVT